MDLRFLISRELKSIKHLIESILSRYFGAGPGPFLVSGQGESAGREPKHEYYYHGHSKLPFAFIDDVHLLTSPSLLHRRRSRSAPDHLTPARSRPVPGARRPGRGSLLPRNNYWEEG